MDSTSFERTVAVYRPDFYRISLAMLGSADEAEDVAQDTLLKLWNIRDTLDRYASIKALGMTVARRKCIDLLRMRQPGVGLSELSADHPDMALTSEQRIIQAEACAEAFRLLDMLPERQRLVLEMRHIQGMETADIAEAIGSNEGNVRVALSRARTRLKELFNRQK